MSSKIKSDLPKILEWLNGGQLLWPVTRDHVRYVVNCFKILPSPEHRQAGWRFTEARRNKLRDFILARQKARLAAPLVAVRRLIDPASEVTQATLVKTIADGIQRGILSGGAHRTHRDNKAHQGGADALPTTETSK
jgi:hypothetical protein